MIDCVHCPSKEISYIQIKSVLSDLKRIYISFFFFFLLQSCPSTNPSLDIKGIAWIISSLSTLISPSACKKLQLFLVCGISLMKIYQIFPSSRPLSGVCHVFICKTLMLGEKSSLIFQQWGAFCRFLQTGMCGSGIDLKPNAGSLD